MSGDLYLKRKIFREADSNSEAATAVHGPVAALVRKVFETAVFPNMVRTGHWIVGGGHRSCWYINLIADIQVSRLIRQARFVLSVAAISI